MPVWDDPDFMARRERARQRIAERLGLGAEPDERRTWFEQVYEQAGRDAAAVPWADLAPRQALADWLAARDPGAASGKRAIDVACGLGDNAEALSDAGYDVTAFDLSETAVAWAGERFPESSVTYRTADLFDLPAEWSRAFDLVHECYTVQALTGEMRTGAIARIADLVAPGGELLIIARGRDEGEEVEGPPWPLSPGEVSLFADHGLTQTVFEDLIVQRDRPIRHFRVLFTR